MIKGRDTVESESEEVSRQARHDLPQEFVPPSGATNTFKVDSCAAQVLWHKGGRKEGGPSQIRSPGMNQHFLVPHCQGKQRAKDSVMGDESSCVVRPSAQFDWWGLQGRFVFEDDNENCEKDFSVAFSHPAVPASTQPEAERISVKVNDNPYNKFFSINDGREEEIRSTWIAALLDVMGQEEERRGFPENDNITETLRRSLEIFSNVTAVAREFEFPEKQSAYPSEIKTVLRWSSNTPVFMTYPELWRDGSMQTAVRAISNATGVNDWDTAKFQNYLPPKVGDEPRSSDDQESDYEWFDFKSNGRKKYTLVYLNGTVRQDGAGSRIGWVNMYAAALTESWSMFADGRFQ
ncbi:hypothetical protein QFC22_005676 [Naganishia vaughanmartiniae]|uniref:Uncharacterized protein n=1 Tax=Naganishia vaughanmartiniae TaxID=1424756 RepID=A0ACC2WSS9_9TREE|nr:hypothetical protein QFC22_005676 [Naganishia vaughanmartiniae]